MTLIVAWRCSDGVVVGADSAATLGAAGQETVKEITTKLYLVKDSIVLGLSGPIGLAQRYYGLLDAMPTPERQGLSNSRPHDASTKISGMLWQHAQVEYQRAQVVSQAVGTRAALIHAHHATVVALRVQGTDRLFQFSETCAPEEATEELPYVSIGSGQQNADPFLAFVRRIYWPRSVPNLSGGIFATLWTLIQTIQSSPGRVGEPITIATLHNGRARFLDDSEMEEHRQAIRELEDSVRRFRDELEPKQ